MTGKSLDTARRRRQEGATAAELFEEGYSLDELKPLVDERLFKTRELWEAKEFSRIELDGQAFFKAFCLSDAWGPVRGLRVMVEAGIQLEDFRPLELGISAADIRVAGYHVEEIYEEGYTLAQLRAAGFKPREIWNGTDCDAWLLYHTDGSGAGFKFQECYEDGIPLQELHPAANDVPISLIRDMGFTAGSARRGGYTLDDVDGYFTEDEIIDAGYMDKSDWVTLNDRSRHDSELIGRVAKGLASQHSVGLLVGKGWHYEDDLKKLYSARDRKAHEAARERAKQAAVTIEEIEEAWKDLLEEAKKYYTDRAEKRAFKKAHDLRSLNAWDDSLQVYITDVAYGRLPGWEEKVRDAQETQRAVREKIQGHRIIRTGYEDKRAEFVKRVNRRIAWLRRQSRLQGATVDPNLEALRSFRSDAERSLKRLNQVFAKRFYPPKVDAEMMRAAETIDGLIGTGDAEGNLMENLPSELKSWGVRTGEYKDPTTQQPGKKPPPPLLEAEPTCLYQLNQRIHQYRVIGNEYDTEIEILQMLKSTQKRADKAYQGTLKLEAWYSTCFKLAESITTARSIPTLIKTTGKRIWSGEEPITWKEQKDITGAISFSVEVGVSYGEGLKLRMGIVFGGGIRVDDDRRLRCNVSLALNFGLELSPPAWKFYKATAKLGLTLVNQTYVFVDEKHFAYYWSFRLASVIAARRHFDTYDNLEIETKSRKYNEWLNEALDDILAGNPGVSADEARQYLADCKMVKVNTAGTTSVDLGFEDSLTGLSTGATGSYSPRRFQRQTALLSDEREPSFVVDHKTGETWAFSVSVSGTVYVSFNLDIALTIIRNDANPDNDGTYVNFKFPSTAYVPAMIAFKATPTPPKFEPNENQKAIQWFMDKTHFLDWNEITKNMGAVKGLGFGFEETAWCEANFIIQNRFARLQYLRVMHGTSIGANIAIGIETGAGEVGLDAKTSYQHTVTMTERVGDNTLTYVWAVYSGLHKRPNGREEWKRWVKKNRNGMLRILKRIGRSHGKTSTANVYKEAQEMQETCNQNIRAWKGADADPAGGDELDFLQECADKTRSWKTEKYSTVKKVLRNDVAGWDGLCGAFTLLLERSEAVRKAKDTSWRSRREYLTRPLGSMRVSLDWSSRGREIGDYVVRKAPRIQGFSASDVWSNPELIGAPSLAPFYEQKIHIVLSVRNVARRGSGERGKVQLDFRYPHGWEDLKAKMTQLVEELIEDPFKLSGMYVTFFKAHNLKPLFKLIQLPMYTRLHPDLHRDFQAWRDEFELYAHAMANKEAQRAGKRIADGRSLEQVVEQLPEQLRVLAQEAFAKFEADHPSPAVAIMESIKGPFLGFRETVPKTPSKLLRRRRPNQQVREQLA